MLGSPFGPRGRPLHALQPLRTLVHPLFIRFGGSAEQANTPNEECLFEHQNGASRPRERRDDFSRFQAWLKPCLGSLEQGTGLECLWTLWRARIQRPNRFEQIEHRTANRSRVGHEIQNARLVSKLRLHLRPWPRGVLATSFIISRKAQPGLNSEAGVADGLIAELSVTSGLRG